MSPYHLTLRSSLSSNLMRKTLIRGTLIAAFGAFSLIGAGAFIPPNHLATIGLPLFLASSLIITSGLMPYRKLKKLELNPYELEVSETSLTLKKSGKVQFSAQKSAITSMVFIDQTYKYGIKITLDDSNTLYLPYFTKKSLEKIQDLFKDQTEECHEA